MNIFKYILWSLPDFFWYTINGICTLIVSFVFLEYVGIIEFKTYTTFETVLIGVGLGILYNVIAQWLIPYTEEKAKNAMYEGQNYNYFVILVYADGDNEAFHVYVKDLEEAYDLAYQADDLNEDKTLHKVHIFLLEETEEFEVDEDMLNQGEGEDNG